MKAEESIGGKTIKSEVWVKGKCTRPAEMRVKQPYTTGLETGYGRGGTKCSSHFRLLGSHNLDKLGSITGRGSGRTIWREEMIRNRVFS